LEGGDVKDIMNPEDSRMERSVARVANTSLAENIDRMVGEAELGERLDGKKVRCFACGHRCVILDGFRGICKVRFNQDGKLMAPRGYVAALQCDPTEKKPFFHVLPGSLALTFGMLGCDYHCGYCQNWLTSQALRDPVAGAEAMEVTPEQVVEVAKRYDAKLVVSSYNEPLITAEWAIENFKAAKREGLRTAFVSNGNATPEVLKYIRPWTDCYKVDLKSMSEKNYRELGGKIENVLATIKMLHEMGFWVEVVTLVVPGFNDSDAELKDCAEFLTSVSADIPWHVTAFHKDYKMLDPDDTTPKTLLRAARIGEEAGLRYVYAGNLPGSTGKFENTYCHNCKGLLVERRGYSILKSRVGKDGSCPDCGSKIPGVWG